MPDHRVPIPNRRTGRPGLRLTLALVVSLAAMVLAAPASAAGWKLATVAAPAGAPDSGMDGISCTSATFCMSVGSTSSVQWGWELTGYGSLTGDFAERWNGTAWTELTMPSVTGAKLSAVSCSSAQFCVAVGEATSDQSSPLTPFPLKGLPAGTGHALVELWNGSTWAVQSTAASSLAHSGLWGVSCVSSTFCTTVGRHGIHPLTLFWNGSSWRVLQTPRRGRQGLTSVSCLSARWCDAVGATAKMHQGLPFVRPLAEHWNGRHWTVTKPPKVTQGAILNAGELTGVSCRAKRFCLASGYAPTSQGDWSPVAFALRWNGSRWTTAMKGLAPAAELTGVTCAKSTACLMVGTLYTRRSIPGSKQKPLIEDWNGKRWSKLHLPATPALSGSRQSQYGGLSAVSCAGRAHCAAAGWRPNGAAQQPLLLSGTASAPARKHGGGKLPQPIYFWGNMAAMVSGVGVTPSSNPRVIRPHTILMFADGSWYLSKLHWSHWGKRTAHATGVDNERKVSPGATGYSHFKTRVTLSKPRRFEGHEVYSCMTDKLVHRKFQAKRCLTHFNKSWGFS